MKRSPRSAPYHTLSVQEKQAEALGRAREPAGSCLLCGAQVMPVDLPVHVQQRCMGPTTPGVGSKWITWRETLAIGIPGYTLSRWVESGAVLVDGPPRARRYLLRDVAIQDGFRRRTNWLKANRARKRIR